MAEHDAKTLRGLSTSSDAPLNSPSKVSLVSVVHLLGGQILIGSLTSTQMNMAYSHLERPYEVFAFPNKEDTSTQITLVKYGTMLGCMPELGVNEMILKDSQVLKYMGAPPKLLQAYYAALQQELNPVTKEQVAAAITPGKAQP